jgi:hypothetical protein
MKLMSVLKLFAIGASVAWVAGFWIATWTSYLDDAFIGFAHIQNYLEGFGFAFNANDIVEGATNTGWLLMLTPLSVYLPIPVVAKILNLIFVISTACIVYSIGLRHSRFAGSAAALLTITSFDFLYFSSSGMETAFISLILGGAILSVCRGHHILSIMLFALSYAVRPEAILIGPLWVSASVATRTFRIRKAALLGLLWCAIICIIQLSRYSYYGEWLPNTFAAKPTSSYLFLIRLAGLPAIVTTLKNISPPFSSFVAICLVIIGFLTKWKRPSTDQSLYLALSAVVVTSLLFCVYARQDWTGFGRYFAPYVPYGFILLVIGLDYACRTVVNVNYSRAIKLAAVSGLCFAGVFDALFWLRPIVQEKYPWYVANSKRLIPAAQWISDNLDHDSVIATRRIGALGFYGRRYVFDYKFGLIHKDVAQLITRHGRTFDSPDDEVLASVWHERMPTHIIEDLPILKRLTWDETETYFYVHGIAYKPIKHFAINENLDWVLSERVIIQNPQ